MHSLKAGVDAQKQVIGAMGVQLVVGYDIRGPRLEGSGGRHGEAGLRRDWTGEGPGMK